MQRIKKTLGLLALIGLLAISAWYWRQYQIGPDSGSRATDVAVHQEKFHVPEAESVSGTTLSGTDASEWARRYAARGRPNDVQSLSRKFKETNDCLLYHSARRELMSISGDDRLDDLSNETLATLQNIDATSNRYLSIVRRTEAFCGGSDPDALARAYTDAMFEAALQGDPDAESCFVIGGLSPVEIASSGDQESLEQRYVKYAPVFTQNALERGDPYVAARALYRYIASPGGHSSRLDDLQKADPYLTWRAARLASLRALPEQRTRLGERLAIFEGQKLLQLDEIKRADAWAAATYQREFAGQPLINLDSHAPCYSSPDLAP